MTASVSAFHGQPNYPSANTLQTMNKLLFTFAALLLGTTLSLAQENRIKPHKNIIKAPGSNYVMLSDGAGDFQIVPAYSLPVGSGGDVVTAFTYNGNDLAITTDQDVFAVNVNAGTVETTVPISINGTAYPSGTDIQTLLGAIGTAIDNIGLVDNGDGTYTFTDTNGNTVTINAGGSAASASNGLNDWDASSATDIELGGDMERHTTVNGVRFDLDWESFLNYRITDLQGQFIAATDTIGGNQGQIFIGPATNMMRSTNYTLGNKAEVYTTLAGATTIRHSAIDNSYPSIVNVSPVSMEFTRKALADTSRFVFSQDSAILQTTQPLDLSSDSGISFFGGKYEWPNATPGPGQKVMVWNSGTPSFQDYATGGGGSAPTIAAISGGGATIMVKYTGTAPTLSGSAGNWTITVPAGTMLDWFRWNGNNSFLTAGGDMNITVQWLGVTFNTSQADAVIPDITLVERTTTLNQQLDVQGAGWNVTCPNAGIGGGATTSVISGLNGFGGDWTIIGEF